MKALLTTSLLLLFSTTLFATDECPQYTGSYRIKVGELFSNLMVEEESCQYSFYYTYESGYQEVRQYIPDGQLRTVFDDGRRIIKERSEIVKLTIGTGLVKLALKVVREEHHRNIGLIQKSISHFYGEQSSQASSLVEKRDYLTASDERDGTVYLGYVKD